MALIVLVPFAAFAHALKKPLPSPFPLWFHHQPQPVSPFLCDLPCFLPFLASLFPFQGTTLPCVSTIHSCCTLSLSTHRSLPCVTTVHTGIRIRCTASFLLTSFLLSVPSRLLTSPVLLLPRCLRGHPVSHRPPSPCPLVPSSCLRSVSPTRPPVRLKQIQINTRPQTCILALWECLSLLLLFHWSLLLSRFLILRCAVVCVVCCCLSFTLSLFLKLPCDKHTDIDISRGMDMDINMEIEVEIDKSKDKRWQTHQENHKQEVTYISLHTRDHPRIQMHVRVHLHVRVQTQVRTPRPQPQMRMYMFIGYMYMYTYRCRQFFFFFLCTHRNGINQTTDSPTTLWQPIHKTNNKTHTQTQPNQTPPPSHKLPATAVWRGEGWLRPLQTPN